MIIHVSATLKAGKLVKGKHTWPFQIGFEGNRDIQSFYLKLEQENSFALNCVLQDMLGDADTKLMSGCQVDNAGIFYMNKTEDKQEVCRLVKQLDSSAGDAVEGLITNSETLPRNCICMWLIADLRNMEVLRGLLCMGYDGNEQLTILACFAQDEKNFLKKGFYAELPSIKLLDIFEFREIKLKYVITGPKTKKMALSGEVALQIQSHTFSFHGDLDFDEQGYNASLSVIEQDKALAPFSGKVDELDFGKLVFHMKCTYGDTVGNGTSEYFLSGEVNFAGMKTEGLIYFADNKILLATVRLDTDFSLARLWNHIFPDCNIDDNVFDILFLGGSEMYYCTDETETYANGRCYEKGFGVSLVTELTLIKKLELSGQLRICEDYVQAALYSMTPIDLGILRIEGTTVGGMVKPGPGVAFRLQKNEYGGERAFEISGSIIFFEEKITDGTIRYYRQADKWRLRAELALPACLQGIFGSAPLAILYSSSTGFCLEHVSAVSLADDKLDFVKIFNKLMTATKQQCKEFKLEENTKKVHIKFNLKPGLAGSVNESETGRLPVRLTVGGTIELFKDDGGVLLTRTVSPVIELSVKKTVNAVNIAEMLCGALDDMVTDVIHMLFNDTGSFEELYGLLSYMLGNQLEKYLEALLCRKLLDKNKADKLRNKKNADTEKEKKQKEEQKKKEEEKKRKKEKKKKVEERHKGGRGGRNPITDSFVAGGGSAFGGTFFENLFYGFMGGMCIAFTLFLIDDEGEEGGDDGRTIEEKGENDRLPCPWFEGEINASAVVLKLEKIEHAIGYELDVVSFPNGNMEIAARKDTLIRIDISEPNPELSLLDIAVSGMVYIAVRALHEKPELSSDWSEAEYMAEITPDMLVSWAKNADYCIRDCFEMLKKHEIMVSDMGVLEAVMLAYGTPDSMEDIAAEHYKAGDAAFVCMEHIDRAYPHLSGEALTECMWNEGYERCDIARALTGLRQGIAYEDAVLLLNKILEKRGKDMGELSVEFTRLMEQRKKGTGNEEEWLAEIAVLYANYEPLELAKLLKAAPMDALEIAYALKRVVVLEKAVTIGALILHPDIYPDTPEQAMRNILHEVFPEENIDKVIGILYPVRVMVSANTVWNDTGIDIFEDEIVTVTYCGGMWSINPGQGFSDASGINVTGKPGYTLPGKREGCLVGKIGNSEVLYIGMQSTLPCGAGRLFLGANDDIDGRYGVGFRDNAGMIEVRINKKLR